MKNDLSSLLAALLLISMLLFRCSGSPEPVVQSPFSHLDTVTTKSKNDDKKDKDGNSVQSPFSHLDK